MDLAGNVSEWTSSAWRDDLGYPYDPRDGREEAGTDELRRVFRGGSWAQSLADCEAWRREADPPGLRGTVVGMRIVVRD